MSSAAGATNDSTTTTEGDDRAVTSSVVAGCEWAIEYCNNGLCQLFPCQWKEGCCTKQIHLECQVLWEATCDNVCREVCANGKRILYCPDHHPSYIGDLLKTFEAVADKDSVATSAPSLPAFIDRDIVGMPPPKKQKPGPRPKNNQWWPEILKLERDGIVDLKPQGIHPDTKKPFEDNVHVICLLCRDSTGASNGVLSLRTPFNQSYWDIHVGGVNHTKYYETHIARQARTGKEKAQVQKSVTSFFTTTATKSSNGDDAANSKRPTITTTASGPEKVTVTDCAGIYNSYDQKWKQSLRLTKMYILISGKEAKFSYGVYGGLPCVVANNCTGRGEIEQKSGGRHCLNCAYVRGLRGNSNPSSFLRPWGEKLSLCISRRARHELLPIDIANARSFAVIKDECFTESGKQLKQEARAQVEYVDQMALMVKKLPPETYDLTVEGSAPSSKAFLGSLATVLRKHPELADHLVMNLLKSLVYELELGKKCHKIEANVKNFYRYLNAMNPRACEAVAANLGSAPSQRWMRVLNARERTSCVFECNPEDIEARVSFVVDRRLDKLKKSGKGDTLLSFSVAIDATKAVEAIELSLAFKAICGGAYPNHYIETEDLTAEGVKLIVDQDRKASIQVTKANEIKVALVSFQETGPGTRISPVEIIVARPQTTNEVSSFTSDVVTAVNNVVARTPGTSFLNFCVDGVSAETSDVMTALCQFLDGKVNYTASVDNKHNIKNDRYQIIGGSCLPTIGTLIIDADLLRAVGIPESEYRVKDFASDKLVDDLCSHKTIDALYKGLMLKPNLGCIKDAGVLAATLFFMKLHLHAVNARTVPGLHRALYLWVSMLWFISLDGVNMTPKRNLVTETMSNMFLSLRSDVTKTRYTTTEVLEHHFGNNRRLQREFTCSDYASLSEKSQRMLNQLFEGDLKSARKTSEQSGYCTTEGEWLEHAKKTIDEKGPCKISIGDDEIPVAHQLWKYVKQVILEGNRLMKPLFRVVGIADSRLAPFCREFNSCDDLLKQYIDYCPRTFKYNDRQGNGAPDDAVMDDIKENEQECDNDQNERLASRIELFFATHRTLTAKKSGNGDGNDCSDSSDCLLVSLESNNERNTTGTKKEVDHTLILDSFRSMCNDTNNADELLRNVRSVSAALESLGTERGSSSTDPDRKVKSLHGRWFGHAEKATTAEGNNTAGEFLVERNVIVTCNTKLGTGKNAKDYPRNYRVLGVYDKYNNKWFMTGEKKSWGRSISATELKKYRLGLRMVEGDDIFEQYDDVALDDDKFKIKDICRIVDGSQVTCVKGKCMM